MGVFGVKGIATDTVKAATAAARMLVGGLFGGLPLLIALDDVYGRFLYVAVP